MSTPVVARYLRILYHITLLPTYSTPPPKSASRTPKTDMLLRQALALADEAVFAADPAHFYPVEEIEWLATSTFNRAVDAYSASDETECRRLVEQALELADRVQDQGILRRLLVERYGYLRFDGMGET